MISCCLSRATFYLCKLIDQMHKHRHNGITIIITILDYESNHELPKNYNLEMSKYVCMFLFVAVIIISTANH